MPITNTRQKRAIALLRTIEDFDPVGPSLSLTHEQAETLRKRFQTWQRSWVRHEIIDLVRELAPIREAMDGHSLGFDKLDDILDATRKHIKDKREAQRQSAHRDGEA